MCGLFGFSDYSTNLVTSKGLMHFLEICALIFNIIGFIPLGMAFRRFFKRPLLYLFCFLIATGIEVFQLIAAYGGMKPEDIVEYMLGAFIGVILFEKVFTKIKPEKINKGLRVLIYILTPVAIFIIINTIVHFPG